MRNKLFRWAVMLVAYVVGALAASMFAVGDVHGESDGNAVQVDLLYTVTANEVAIVDGWMGITQASGDSGDSINLSVDSFEVQLQVPSGLSVSKGDVIYIEVADVTGHIPDDTAYSTSAGSGKAAFAKATRDKDANNIVRCILFRMPIAAA